MVREKNGQLRTGKGKSDYTWITDRNKIYDCYGVLEKIAWIWRIVGIFPFTMKGPVGLKKYSINTFYAVYSVLVCCAGVGDAVYSIVKYHNWVRNKPDVSVQYVTMTTRTIAIVLCMISASVWRIFRHKEMSEIVYQTVEQDSILRKMNCSMQYESNVKIICTYVWTMLTTLTLLAAYDCYVMRLILNCTLLWWLFWISPMVAQFFDVTIFVSLVGLLGWEFRALNEKISTVVVKTNSFAPKIIVTSDFCAEYLRTIAKGHYSVCTVGKRLNSFFNTTVIINVTTTFIVVSTNLYYIFVEVQRDGETNYFRIFLYVDWQIIHGIQIITIVAICNWTSYHSIHTGKLIHEIRVEKIDSRLYESVKTFSLQLHHQKLEFNAGGFFPLNSTLIQMMVGNITTYLVILIQFQPKLDIDIQ